MAASVQLNTLGNLLELQKAALNLKIDHPNTSDLANYEYVRNVILDMLCGKDKLDHAPDLVYKTIENGGVLYSGKDALCLRYKNAAEIYCRGRAFLDTLE